MKALLLLPFLLPACTVRPSIKMADGSIATLGGSIFTRSTGETASYSGPLGTMAYTDMGKDETVLPSKYFNFKGLKATIDGATAATRTNASTERILGEQSVQKQAIKSTENVESLKILNPVEVAP